MYIDLQITGITKQEDGFLIKETIEQALLTLMPRVRRLISIDIQIALPEDMNEVKAYVHEEEKDNFIIALNQDALKDKNDLIVILCHECVHIKQYVTKEYKRIGRNHYLFNGQSINTDTCPYYKLPWEEEAYGMEKELARAQKNYTG